MSRRNSYFKLHFSVFLWGFTAILGKFISLHEVPLVWYRVLFTVATLMFIPGLLRSLKSISFRTILQAGGIGCIVIIHWICFYGSIKYANASIALSCLAITSFIISFIEPWVTGEKMNYREMLLGLFIIPGIWLIANTSDVRFSTGIVLGIAAAILAALFTSLNKRMTSKMDSYSMTFVELSGGFILISFILPFYEYYFPEASFIPTTMDWFSLALLAVVCTALPFILSLQALKHLSAFATALTVNLEPIYGIIMAIFFFHENKELSIWFYLGTAIILTSVFVHPLLKKPDNSSK